MLITAARHAFCRRLSQQKKRDRSWIGRVEAQEDWPKQVPWLGSWASCARIVGSGSAPMYLPLTYTLVEVDAAIAFEREATTMTVAIASLLNMGVSVCWRAVVALSHAHEFA